TVDQKLGAYCCVDFADPAFAQYGLSALNCSFNEYDARHFNLPGIMHIAAQQFNFFVHRADQAKFGKSVHDVYTSATVWRVISSCGKMTRGLSTASFFINLVNSL